MQQPLHPPAKLFSASTVSRLFFRLLKKIKLFLILLLLSMNIAAQEPINEDSLKAIINENTEDTDTYNALMSLAIYYNNSNYVKYAQQALALAKKSGDQKREAFSLVIIGTSLVDYIQSVQTLTNALSIYEALKDSL